MTGPEAPAAVIALVTAVHHDDPDAATAITASFDRGDVLEVLAVAVKMLTHEIESACRCCVGFSVDEFLQQVALANARIGQGPT